MIYIITFFIMLCAILIIYIFTVLDTNSSKEFIYPSNLANQIRDIRFTKGMACYTPTSPCYNKYVVPSEATWITGTTTTRRVIIGKRKQYVPLYIRMKKC